MRKKCRFRYLIFGIICGLHCAVHAEDTTNRPPNLIVIMADDLGYGDLSCYGSEVHHTPNLDRMADEGIRFTDFYVTSPVCTPTRVALLTGRHPVRVGFTTLLWPTTPGGLPETENTLPELLKKKGYTTALIGKWHLGHSEPKYLPLNHGFDLFYGMPYPNDMGPNHPQTVWRKEIWPPMPMMRGNEIVEAPIDVNLLEQQYNAAAVQFIAENHHKPFFLFLSHAMPHTIIGASPDFVGTSKNGLFGDSVQELDWSVGNILRTLRAFSLEENTLIFFTSDNGAVTRAAYQDEEKAQAMFPDLTFGTNAPLRGGKQSTYEGGVRVPGIAYWPENIEAGQIVTDPIIVSDIFPTYLKAAGISIPQHREYDGVDISGRLFSGESLPERALYFGKSEITAMREGKWKLVLPNQPHFVKSDSDAPMLYNLSEDISEQNNLADQYPDIVDALLQRLNKAQAAYDADPISR